MLFTVNTKTGKIAARGCKTVFPIDPSMNEYWDNLEKSAASAGGFIDKSPTFIKLDGSCIVFGTSERPYKEVVDEEGNIKKELQDPIWTSYFKFDLADYVLKDNGGEPLSPNLITHSVSKCNIADDSRWLRIFYDLWKSFAFTGKRSSQKALHMFTLDERSKRRLQVAEKLLRSGFCVSVCQIEGLLRNIATEDLEAASQSPWTLLNVPKRVYKVLASNPDYRASICRWSGLSRIKDFGCWDQIWDHVVASSDTTSLFLDLITDDKADALKELLQDRSYDPKRLVQYLFEDLPQKQGIQNISDGSSILVDYARMCAAVYESGWDKYPKYLKSEHDIVLLKFNSLQQVFNSKNLIEQYETAINSGLNLSYENRLISPPDSEDYRYYISYPRVAADIAEEGKFMHHCVASYVDRIRADACLIAFLRSKDYSYYGNRYSKVLTLEINPSAKSIVQARGKYNRVPTEQEFKFLAAYCADSDLHFSESVNRICKDEIGKSFEELVEELSLDDKLQNKKELANV